MPVTLSSTVGARAGLGLARRVATMSGGATHPEGEP
jgi:hypothetical protein